MRTSTTWEPGAAQLIDQRPAAGVVAGSRHGSGGAPASASLTAFQTRSGVHGMSTWRMPRWDRASITAFCTAGVAPIVPASPMPLTPRGLSGERVSVLDTSKEGNFGRRRHQVVDEGTGQRIAVFVVPDLLEQGLPAPAAIPPCCWPATMSGIEHEAAVVHGDVAQERDRPVSVSTSTTATWVAEGEAGVGLLEDHGGAEAVGLDLSSPPAGTSSAQPSGGAGSEAAGPARTS